MKIYIDILLVTNAIMTLIMLEAAGRVCHKVISPLRLLTACSVGGLSSLVMAIDSRGYFTAVLIVVIKLVSAVFTVLIAFGCKDPWQLLRYFIIYCAVDAVFTGIVVTLWQISGSKVIFFRNLTVYFDISLFKLALACGIAYGLLCLYENITRRCFNRVAKYEAIYENGGCIVKVPAICDSGNRLCDSFTGTPVVVFCCDRLFYHYDLDRDEPDPLSGFRLIPCSTVSGEGIIHITAAGSVKIIDDKDRVHNVRCYVGVKPSLNGKSRAIFNPALLG